MSTFRNTQPIDFELYNTNGQSVFYINTSDQVIILEIINASKQGIVLSSLTAPVSSSNYHFMLRFRPGTLSRESLGLIVGSPAISLAAGQEWEMAGPVTDAAGMDVIYLKSTFPGVFILDPNIPEEIKFHNVGGSAAQGARGTRVELRYKNMAFSTVTPPPVSPTPPPTALAASESPAPAAGTSTVGLPLDSYKQTHLAVIHPMGDWVLSDPGARLPMEVSAVGDSGVLNDGTTPNTLRLRFYNTQVYDPADPGASALGFLYDVDTASKSKFILSFDTGASQKEASAIGEAQTIDNITINQPAEWEIVLNNLGINPEWTLSPSATNIILNGKNTPLPGGGFLPHYFDLELTNLITDYPAGLTYLYIRYENIPNYNDGMLVVPIEKRPLVYNDGNVGIGTNSPGATLDVARGTAFGGTAQFRGTDRTSHFNYSTDEHTYIRGGKSDSHVSINDDGGNVGIGTNSPGATLDVARGTAFGGTAQFRGTDRTSHFNYNTDEHTYIRGGKSGSHVFINDDGGNVGIGTNDPKSQLDVGGDINSNYKIKEKNHDLIPRGTIVMWFGNTSPNGWVICDGKYYDSDGVGYTGNAADRMETPNLTDRFVVGAGNAYALSDTGGSNEVSLTTSQMPPHNHNATCSTDGKHHHTIGVRGFDAKSVQNGADGSSDNPQIPTQDAGDHNHVITIGITGGGVPHENRPPYCALYYIMKL